MAIIICSHHCVRDIVREECGVCAPRACVQMRDAVITPSRRAQRAARTRHAAASDRGAFARHARCRARVL